MLAVRYVDFQKGLARTAFIVARAHQRCAARPFANLQSDHSSAVANAAGTGEPPCHHQPVHHNHFALDPQGTSLQTEMTGLRPSSLKVNRIHVDRDAFTRRFGPTPDPYLQFHRVVVDGAFDASGTGTTILRAASRPDPRAIAGVEESCASERLRPAASPCRKRRPPVSPRRRASLDNRHRSHGHGS
jgi:hypothetical protein